MSCRISACKRMSAYISNRPLCNDLRTKPRVYKPSWFQTTNSSIQNTRCGAYFDFSLPIFSSSVMHIFTWQIDCQTEYRFLTDTYF